MPFVGSSSRNLYRYDLAMSYKADYTFHHDLSNCYSQIDYFITSDSQFIAKFEILDSRSFLSDHFPIAITFGFTLTPTGFKPCSSCHPSQVNYLRWDHVDLQSYYSVTRQLFQQLVTTFNETDIECVSPTEIADFVNNVYNNIVEILYSNSIEYIPACKKHSTNSDGIRNSTPSKTMLSNLINFGKPPASHFLVLFLIKANPTN